MERISHNDIHEVRTFTAKSELSADSPDWYSTFGIRIFMTNHPHHHPWV